MADLNKKQAQEFLGISDRTLERYVKERKISVKYINTNKGKSPIFDSDELERFKLEKQAVTHSPAIVKQGTTSPETVLTEFVANPEISAAAQICLEVVARSQLINVLRQKMLLNLGESSALSGLSKSWLVGEIKKGRLKAKKLGNGWKIRVTDLQVYIDSQFDLSAELPQ
jgi:hypothetical protein